jgi:hypothetical protein
MQPDLSVIGSAVSGDPRQVLIDLSAEAHLLVVGSRGRGGVRSMLLGSVSATVSAHAACPVVVCRPTAVDHAEPGVIVGADATPESLPVIEFAYRQASLRRLPITVLHSYWDAAAALAQYHEARGERVDAPELEDLRAELSESVAGGRHPMTSLTRKLSGSLAIAVVERAHATVVVVPAEPRRA